MSTLSKAAVQTKISTYIVPNQSRAITALKVQEILTDLVDSAEFSQDGGSSSTAGNYTLQLSDAGKTVEVNSLTDTTLTIPNNTNVAFSTNVEIEIYQYGTGKITIQGESGVTIRSFGNKYTTAGLYAVIKLRKRATNEWVLSGNAIV